MRIPISSLKLAVEIFDDTGHFGMRQGEVLDSFFQQGIDISIEKKKPDDIEEKEWSTINWLHEELFDRVCPESKSMLSRMRLLRRNCGRHWRRSF